MRLLALDVGAARIGLAVSDALGMMAWPKGHIERTRMTADIAAVADKAKEFDAEAVVVGMPLTLRGAAGRQAEIISHFCERLRSGGDINVITWDERYSTAAAEHGLRQAGVKPSKSRGRSDAAAAAVILQSYLDSRRSD